MPSDSSQLLDPQERVDLGEVVRDHLLACRLLHDYARDHGAWGSHQTVQAGSLDQGIDLDRAAHGTYRIETDLGYDVEVRLEPNYYMVGVRRSSDDALVAAPYVLALPYMTVMPPSQAPRRRDASDRLIRDDAYLQTLRVANAARGVVDAQVLAIVGVGAPAAPPTV